MPRPVKWRRITFMPKSKCFKPAGIQKDQLEEVQLKMEELEAMRLKDIKRLSQIECAQLMEVSRQTFQLIIDEARRKVALALTKGMVINITGGKYTHNVCKYKCESCGHEFASAYEANNKHCPACNEEQLSCREIDSFCKKVCEKRCCKNIPRG